MTVKFDTALNYTLPLEGGYVNDPHDPGGETNFGICKRNHPNVDIKNLTREQAAEIYQREYWQESYERINSLAIVNKVFSEAVNIGVKNANICLQRAVRASIGILLKEDGVLGNLSIIAINRAPFESLLACYKSELAGHYRAINDPDFINGWLNRAYA